MQLWSSNPSSIEAMGGVRKEYERQLLDVRQRIAVLQDVEAELTTSLAFLEGCRNCQQLEDHPRTACVGCERLEQGETSGPTLITGLMAH